jgi:hypothetical protein
MAQNSDRGSIHQITCSSINVICRLFRRSHSMNMSSYREYWEWSRCLVGQSLPCSCRAFLDVIYMLEFVNLVPSPLLRSMYGPYLDNPVLFLYLELVLYLAYARQCPHHYYLSRTFSLLNRLPQCLSGRRTEGSVICSFTSVSCTNV